MNTWYYRDSGTSAALARDSDGKVVARVRMLLDGTWTYEGQEYISETAAKKAAEMYVAHPGLRQAELMRCTSGDRDHDIDDGC